MHEHCIPLYLGLKSIVINCIYKVTYTCTRLKIVYYILCNCNGQVTLATNDISNIIHFQAKKQVCLLQKLTYVFCW